jgi:hypothetical protein
MRRRDLSKALLASAAGPLLVSDRASAVAAPTEGRTAAEIEAAVDPVDARYAPGDVRRYGAKGDGVSDDTHAFQLAIDVARRPNHGPYLAPSGAGAGVVKIPAADAFYLLAGPLDCTFTATANPRGILFQGDAGPSPGTPTIIAKHKGHVFDLTGFDSAVFENLSIGTDTTVNPETCFFLARNHSRSGAGYHRFRNVRVHGKFSRAILYNYGSESNVYSECLWCNESASANAKVAVFTFANIFGLTSTFAPVATGPQSCIDHQILGGNFFLIAGGAEADVFYLDGANNVKIFGPWMDSGVRSHGRALIYVDSTNAASNAGEVFGLQGEVGTATQEYGLYFDGQTVNTASSWTIAGCWLPSAKYAIYCASNTTLDHFHISNLREPVARGVSAEGVIQNSTIDSGVLPLSVGISRRNTLMGDSSRWSIKARDHDFWIDSGAANKTWRPGAESLQIRGQLTISNASCVFHGPLITLCATLTASSSIECPLGTLMSGLPAPAVGASALVNVCDAASGAAIGSGMVTGSKIVLPAIPAVRSIVISASYFTG